MTQMRMAVASSRESATFRPLGRYNRDGSTSYPGNRGVEQQPPMSTVVQTKPPISTDADRAAPLVSVVIPCLNEAENIERCVTAAPGALRDSAIDGEVLVVDNASEDDSAALATAAGARVVSEPRRGYGSAYL